MLSFVFPGHLHVPQIGMATAPEKTNSPSHLPNSQQLDEQVLPSSESTVLELRHRLKTSEASRAILEQFFHQNPYPDSVQYDMLAERANINRGRVKVSYRFLIFKFEFHPPKTVDYNLR